MTDEQQVTIEVDGRPLQASPGTMLIEVTDAAGIPIPRFCYHRKLSVAANCRMCLVEVERAPKPLPACATPVTDGMKVFTRSPTALAAQKGTMEFLLINHPLDCPICDQGGECELQDVALGYGGDVSRYVEAKRVVKDPDLGPLVATDMTRCIHCTRCVRFGAEIAGIREMGATGRGEHMKIGTYVQQSVDSELSGNIIDICPVGALTSRPFRFRARAWELSEHQAIACHDGVGSNLAVHVRRNQVMRVVPRSNDAVNECWISDRDRFSYEALNSGARLTRPMVRENGEWREIGWEQALKQAASLLKEAGANLNTLLSANATLEELYLAQKLTRGLGSNRVDHRLLQSDFRNDDTAALRWLGMPLAELEQLDAVLVIGGNPRKDQPLLGHRLRKAVMAGASLTYLNPCRYDLNHAAEQQVAGVADMARRLAGVARALGVSGPLVDDAIEDQATRALAERLKGADKAAVLLGNLAVTHPDFALLETLSLHISRKAGATLGHLCSHANSVGAQLAGAQPNRLAGGKVNTQAGANAAEMLQGKPMTTLLLGLDPAMDTANALASVNMLARADKVVALSAFRTEGLNACADLLLPVGWFAETSGTRVNAQGDWQSATGALAPRGEARPAWKVLRVLGNLTGLSGFDYNSSDEVLAELRRACEGVALNNDMGDGCTRACFSEQGITRIGHVPAYASDMAVRLAPALQSTRDARESILVRLNGATAARLGLASGATAVINQAGRHVEMPVTIDDGVADDAVVIPAGVPGSELLGPLFGEVTIEKV
jgi:NADH-quinone oxidoreductase subunit G